MYISLFNLLFMYIVENGIEIVTAQAEDEEKEDVINGGQMTTIKEEATLL